MYLNAFLRLESLANLVVHVKRAANNKKVRLTNVIAWILYKIKFSLIDTSYLLLHFQYVRCSELPEPFSESNYFLLQVL